MLILTRRVGETIMIGDDISITCLGTKPGNVRLGIAARRAVPVHRLEVYNRERAEKGLPLVTDAEAQTMLRQEGVK